MTARIPPAEPPFDPQIQERLDRVMRPGVPPLVLFTTLARDKRLFERFMGGGLLDRGHLTLRQREIVIDRTTGLCGSEYEWGVHVALFGERAGLTSEQIRVLANKSVEDAEWAPDEQALIAACDALHANCDIGDDLWQRLQNHFSNEAIMEILMLAGFYHTVSYLTNALRLPLEPYAARFPES
jgi:alkylhydroperoxidase family enzyme